MEFEVGVLKLYCAGQQVLSNGCFAAQHIMLRIVLYLLSENIFTGLYRVFFHGHVFAFKAV